MRAWLSALKHYFIAVHIPYTGNDTTQACQYSVALMRGNAARWIDHLEVEGEVPAALPDFERMFIDQYAPLDDKNIAQDILQELQ